MTNGANLARDIERIIASKDKGVRSADSANMKRMLSILQRGQTLSYQDRVNLEAYFNRYQFLLRA